MHTLCPEGNNDEGCFMKGIEEYTVGIYMFIYTMGIFMIKTRCNATLGPDPTMDMQTTPPPLPSPYLP